MRTRPLPKVEQAPARQQATTSTIVARMLREVRSASGDSLSVISDADLLRLIEELLGEIRGKDD